MTEQLLQDEASARQYVARHAGEDALIKLEQLVEALLVENRQQNLIAKPTEPNIWVRHIADSAQLLRFVPRETSGTWLDLGSGAGFPGLVISALRPEIAVVLVESRARRVEWLELIIETLSLDNCLVEGKGLDVF